ncbi:MAG: hypothetical protein KGL39_27700 [Patescibacteria group bacterium]|nr:hypothetical protein [Patescibacteria group bacterium]
MTTAELDDILANAEPLHAPIARCRIDKKWVPFLEYIEKQEKLRDIIKNSDHYLDDVTYEKYRNIVIDKAASLAMTAGSLADLKFPPKQEPKKVEKRLCRIRGNERDPTHINREHVARIGNHAFVAMDPVAIDSKEPVHEVIWGDRPHRLMIDLDALQSKLDENKHAREDVVRSLLTAMATVATAMAEVSFIDAIGGICLATSSNHEKLSLHASFGLIMLANYADAKHWTKKIIAEMKEYGQYIDEIPKRLYSVRVIGSAKDGRMKLPTALAIENSFTNAHDYLARTPGLEHTCQTLPALNQIQSSYKPGALSAAECKEMEELAAARREGLKPAAVFNNLMQFRRDVGHHHCNMCKRIHGNSDKPGDGAMMWRAPSGSLVFRCRRAAAHIPSIVLKAVKSPEFVRRPKWDYISDIVAGTAGLKGAREIEELQTMASPRIINMPAEELERDRTILPDFADTKAVPSMTLLRSNMGTGKTKLLVNRLRDVLPGRRGKMTTIMTVYRKTLGRAMKKTMEDKGFKVCYYEDVAGEIICSDNDVVIVQVESFHRLRMVANGKRLPHDYEFVLVLDEINSIMRQFQSSPAGNKNSKGAADVNTRFAEVASQAKHIIAMDALANSLTERWLRMLRSDLALSTVVNEFKPRTGHGIKWCDIKDALAEIMECLRNKQRVLVACARKEKDFGAKAVAEMIREKGYTVKVYHSKMDEKQKREDLADIHAAWKDVDAVVYTPTIEAGISYEAEGFHTHFSLISNLSPIHVEQFVQMTRRARNVVRTVVGFDYRGGRHISPLEEDIRAEMVMPGVMMLAAQHKPVDAEVWSAELRTYVTRDSAAVNAYIIHERSARLSRLYFLQWLRYLQTLDGSEITVCRPGAYEVTAVMDEMKAAVKTIRTQDIDAILAATDLKDNEADELLEQEIRTREDCVKLERFFITRTYNIDPEILSRAFLETWYNVKHMAQYKVLKRYQSSGNSDAAAFENLWKMVATALLAGFESLKASAADAATATQQFLVKDFAPDAHLSMVRLCMGIACLLALGFTGLSDAATRKGDDVAAAVAANARVFQAARKMKKPLKLRDRSKQSDDADAAMTPSLAIKLTNDYLTNTVGYAMGSKLAKTIRGRRLFDYFIDRQTVKTPSKTYIGFGDEGAPPIPSFTGPSRQEDMHVTIYGDAPPEPSPEAQLERINPSVDAILADGDD